MLELFWVEFSEHKTELVCFSTVIEGTEVLVDSIYDDVWEAEYDRRGAWIDGFESFVEYVFIFFQCLWPCWILNNNKILRNDKNK